MEEIRTTSSPELLLTLRRDAPQPLHAQLGDALRRAIRGGTLAAGSRLPATRDLAQSLGISRGVVVEAYSQLLAEGYLEARHGSGTWVAEAAAPAPALAPPPLAEPRFRFDFRPGVPDLSLFPRTEWTRALRQVLQEIPDAALGYGDPRGPLPLRQALAAYLGRVRGVAADPDRVLVCNGFAQGIGLICQVLASEGRVLGMEDLSHPDARVLMQRAGPALQPIPVDDAGLCVDELARSPARAVLVSPAHQFPTGVVLSPARRGALLAWAAERDGIILEDDYDAEYRYDAAPVGALQGLAPDRVVYCGSVSKTLAPALRLGWLVLPPSLVGPTAEAKRHADLASPTLDGLAFARLLESGGYDRHLRRARLVYRRRRDTLAQALARHAPSARIRGIAAGLHAVVELPFAGDEDQIVSEAAHHGIRVYGMRTYTAARPYPVPALVLGYAALSEHAIAAGIAALSSILAQV